MVIFPKPVAVRKFINEILDSFLFFWKVISFIVFIVVSSIVLTKAGYQNDGLYFFLAVGMVLWELKEIKKIREKLKKC